MQALATVNYSLTTSARRSRAARSRRVGMIVAPCSIRSAVRDRDRRHLVACCTRAADVMLKERRRLVLMVRETPLHLGHLRSMTSVTEDGRHCRCRRCRPSTAKPANRSATSSITRVGRVLDLFGIDNALVRRWQDADPRHGGADEA